MNTRQYTFLRLPFGLNSTSAMFTHVMKSILMGLKELCTTYLDNIEVHRVGLNDHQNKIGQVFQKPTKLPCAYVTTSTG